MAETRLSRGDLTAACDLLVGNWSPADAPTLLDLLPWRLPTELEAYEEHHTAATAVCGLLKAHADPELIPAARWIYLLNPCASCRSAAVEWLRIQDSFPSAMEAEYRWDAWVRES